MRLPSVKTLRTIAPTAANTLRFVLQQYEEDKSTLQQTMEEANVIIDGHGVEYIRHKKDSSKFAFGIEYVNMGDTYRTTLLFDHAVGSFKVGSWGDIVEKYSDCYE